MEPPPPKPLPLKDTMACTATKKRLVGGVIRTVLTFESGLDEPRDLEPDDDAPIDASRSDEDLPSELAAIIESHESTGGKLTHDAQLSQGGQFGYDK